MEPHIISILPFIGLLLSLAILPFAAPRFWNEYYHFVSVGLGFITAVYYLIITRGWDILHSLQEYVMFISLLSALYIVAGGILIEIKGLATPFRNTVLLALGALLANIIGTTGASMLLIRPYIKTNKIRITNFHIVFFIFIVSNMGGMLIPLGPPLFLGYIKGIPFFWVLFNFYWQWACVMAVLLIVFFIFDYINFNKQPQEIEELEIKSKEKVKVFGLYNLILMGVIIAAVFINRPLFLRELVMLVCAFISYKFTKKEIHQRNHFDFHPMKEVAWLFFGIFVTMTPALELLKLHSSAMGISSPSSYFWLTGLLSALLDNAPTYLAFLTASMGLFGMDVNSGSDVLKHIVLHDGYIIAISVSSVFFGAMTYIGNGPNFMVKSIAEHQKVETPGFFGYLLKFAIPILVPVYFLIWLLFIP